ncbi:MAG: DNA-binding protein [Ignavibacteria bacterium RIFOXYB2_FULL_35_12]|nr:MAG: DNA-binding protein [Ignavibacteria bacterium GWA2_36_19]OGU57087.1 MAG: DNA-binding protein [Ignavibacteria bacterium GWF2_35_20]OGU81682.1 MAG: DNA-binding protein [Ignavibacteria bacterium RIFOXYA2_FULL_35_9]OGU88847.1 MAG: DNA-binding protein [Ignavibacteria bacterium RIFOXYA12_FULL_35_25]OGU90655.1 MAG: DNA-binding protein [Ignavibacteria bacterium RIFOXYC12_FULL_35_11]OGU93677.1 MAG: DNA-binding protein [Ignavibacteria bacterium RIFOXYB12_FULL_35_14]OGV00649.1 MAG: DNA-binding p
MEESKNSLIVYDSTTIQRKIYTVRDVQVMLDSDLAKFYNVETRRLNEQVRRNIDRFPDEFMFQLTKEEYENLMSQIAISSSGYGGRRKLPLVFTEQGIAMLSGVLKSDTAVKMSIQIIRAFVAMRKFIINNAQLFQRIDTVEKRQLKHEIETDEKFEKIFNEMQRKELEPKQGIFFDGQIFDAYKFVAGLIRRAEKSIVLIDNYIDETVLTLFSKRKKKVAVTIFTKEISKPLALDIKKFNAQYPLVDVKVFKDAHDRFMIIDNEDVYHFGASLKDLGKKWFAFSKFDKNAIKLLQKLNEKS